MIRGRLSILVVLSALLALLAGCGGTADQPGSVAPAGAFPVTITHKFGSTTIPAEPKRIVALSYEEDLLGQIGIAPVGHGENPYAPGQPYPWQVGTVDLSGSTVIRGLSGDIELEKLASLRPDLILATNFFNNDEYYERLSRIAPTIPYAEGTGLASWQDTAAVIGKAVGRPEQVQAVVDRTERFIADYRAALPGLEGRTYAGGLYFATGQFSVNARPTGQGPRVRQSIGLRLSPELVAAFPAGTGMLSTERIGLLDADVLIIGFANPQLRTELNRDPLYTRLNAARDGRVIQLDGFGATASNNPTTLNIPWLLDQQRPVLQRVSDRAR